MLIKWLPFFQELFDKWRVNEDCQSMIFLDYLEYDNQKLNEIDEKGDMKFWIVRFVKNYWFSDTSRYYNLYKKKSLTLLDDQSSKVEYELYDEENWH